MIDWTEIDKNSPAAWVALAQRLIGRGQAILTMPSPDPDALREAQRDLGEFVREANLDCPLSAIAAARRASDQITIFLTSLEIDNLEVREARLDAVKARLSSAANELRAEAAAIRLEPIREALTVAIKLATELKSLVTEVESINKADIPDKIAAVARRANKVVREIEDGLKSSVT